MTIFECSCRGPYVPTKRTDKGSVVEKSTDESDQQDRKLCSSNEKAMNIPCCGLNADGFSKISSY